MSLSKVVPTNVPRLPVVANCSNHTFPGPTSNLFNAPSQASIMKSFFVPKGKQNLMDILGVKPSMLMGLDITDLKIFGHRGSLYEHVENTLEGFARLVARVGC